MNAHTPIEVAIDAPDWDQIYRSVNAWRGRAILCFAHAEAAVSETLVAMARVPDRGAKVRLRHLIGQRLDDLATAIGANGPFCNLGQNAASALVDFRQHENLRPFISHGTTRVATDRHGQWVVVLKLVSFRRRDAQWDETIFDQRQAEAALAELKSSTKKLGSALQSLRARLPAQAG